MEENVKASVGEAKFMKPFVVVNPNAGAGRTRRAWPAIAGRLSEIYGPIEAGITGSRGHATQMVRQAVAAGARRVIAIGGDGTINEAVNGLCNGAEPPSEAVELGAVVTGTGGDLRRSFALRRGAEGSLERLAEGTDGIGEDVVEHRHGGYCRLPVADPRPGAGYRSSAAARRRVWAPARPATATT